MSRYTFKEILLILGFIILIGLGAYFLFSRVRPSSRPGEPTPKVTLPPIPATSTLPTSDKIQIGTQGGTVEINNVYKIAVERGSESVVFASTSDYRLNYFTKDSSFAIVIQSNPFDAARAKAEAAFLGKLGITQAQACQLTLYEAVPFSVNESLAGRTFGLSFCDGTVQ